MRRRHAARWPHPGSYVPGNGVEVFYEGASCYSSMLDAMEGARSTIHLETYLLRSDAVGWAFAHKLAQRADDGIECALMYDSVGGMPVSSEYLSFLYEAGVHVVEHHPIWPWRRKFALNQRNHRKILVVDGAVGFVGGMNISDHAMPEHEGGDGWLDVHLRIEGPAAVNLDRLFLEEWARQGGPNLEGSQAAASMRDGVPVRVVENRFLLKMAMVRLAYMDALRHAREKIWIMNSYFAPDRRFVRALQRAARRGIDVRIIVPGKSDVQPVMWAGQHLYERLLNAGVRLFEWNDSILHAKVAVVDGEWLTVGTYNLDHRSLRHNLEVNAIILSKSVACDVERVLEEKAGSSDELTLESWRNRSALARLMSWFFYLFRAWL